MIEFVTFLPREVKSCRLSHLSGTLKWLWHPLGHVSLKLIFFKICQVPLRDGVDSQQASTITKHSMCKRHLRNFLWGAKGLQTLWHIERVLLLRNWLLAIGFSRSSAAVWSVLRYHSSQGRRLTYYKNKILHEKDAKQIIAWCFDSQRLAFL